MFLINTVFVVHEFNSTSTLLVDESKLLAYKIIQEFSFYDICEQSVKSTNKDR
jgi:hypothetical protein